MSKVPYICIEIQLHNCLDITQAGVELLCAEMRMGLIEKLNPDSESDISVELIESAGL